MTPLVPGNGAGNFGESEQFFAAPELPATVLPVARSDHRAVESHVGVPGASVDRPITALVGDRDPQTTIDDASAWEGRTSAEFDLRVVPGGHFFLDAHQAEVADMVVTSLKEWPFSGHASMSPSQYRRR